MHRSEAGFIRPCADCGAPVEQEERVFGFGADAVLCWECALRRGGAYDSEEDRWTVEPGVTDLLKREREEDEEA
jgi:hypothetical protein